MSGFESARALLESFFEDAWLNGSYSWVPIAFQNVEFVPPINKEPWVQFWVIGGQSSIIALGESHSRHEEMIQVDVYTDVGEGSKQSNEISDEVCRILVNQDIPSDAAGRVTTGFPTREILGTDSSPLGDYWKVAVTIPYERDFGLN